MTGKRKPTRGGRNFIDKSAGNNIWYTPPEALAPVKRYAPIGLDPCTGASNPTGAAHIFTEKEDGLAQSWAGYGLVFVNPPYSLTPEAKERGEKPPIRAWSRKIHEEAARGVSLIALLPCGARFSTEYWQDNILVPELVVVCFWRGRIKFIEGDGPAGMSPNYDSIFYGFNVDVERFSAEFDPYGAVFAMRRYWAASTSVRPRSVLPFEGGYMGLSRLQMCQVMEKVFAECYAIDVLDVAYCDRPIIAEDNLVPVRDAARARWTFIRDWIKTPNMEVLRWVRRWISEMIVDLCRLRAAVDHIEGKPPASFEQVFDECHGLREAGQKEYAHEEANAFANFEDDSAAVGVSREATLSIFANKHWRGICAWIAGHRSQRENVRGRINDMIVYLTLLRGMLDENEAITTSAQ